MDLLLSLSSRAALGALLFASLSARAQIFSPGELARPHSHLEGLSNCKKCHGDGEQVPQAKCLDCHKELGARVRAGKGFHGRMREQERACESCHHEHQGKAFALVEWTPSKSGFPHQKTGWPLEGKHREVKCDGCHQQRLIADPDVRALLGRNPRADTLLGLPTRCESCHFDEHRGQLEQSCASCHDASGWRPARGFDHRRTEYPLTGKHRTVACKGCHPSLEDQKTSQDAFPKPVSWSYLKLAPVQYQSCLDCHQDPHDGRFGARCSSCHTAGGWKAVKTPSGQQGFHDKTRFPLKGAHAEVECKACHGPFRGIPAKFKGLPFAACTDCHADAHLGQLGAEKRRPAPCDGCHSVEGFMPASFDLPAHQKTSFALEGAHQAVACNACHKPDPSLEKRITPAVRKELARRKRPERFSLTRFELGKRAEDCEGCHADPHGGQFDERMKKDGCSACHTVASWQQVSFDHQDTNLPLTGKHAETPCASCHRETQVKGRAVRRYSPLERTCDGCHADPHAGQFLAADEHTPCERCHDSRSFKEGTFVHAPPFTQFLLDGKHAQLGCEACHPEVSLGGGGKARRYAKLPTSCEGCHEDYHRGDFRGFVP